MFSGKRNEVALSIAALALHVGALAQPTREPSAPVPDTAVDVSARGERYRSAVLARMVAVRHEFDNTSGSRLDRCYPSGNKLPYAALVVVVRLMTCNTSLGHTEQYAEVLFGEDTYYTKLDALQFQHEGLGAVASRSPQSIESSIAIWKDFAELLWKNQTDKALAEVDATSAYGVAIISAKLIKLGGVKTMGITMRLDNTGKKTIKYVTVNLVGLNAVNDPVTNGYNGSTLVGFRCVGPIKPENIGRCENEQLWSPNELIKRFDLKSIKIEYVDGTSRTVTSPSKVILTQETAALVYHEVVTRQ